MHSDGCTKAGPPADFIKGTDASSRASRHVAHRSTALRGAATAGTGTVKAVINGQLFSCPDFSETVQEDLPADSAHRQIRIATMIYELGAAAPHRPIKLRESIQTNRINPTCHPRPEHPDSTAHGFPLTDPFTRILNHPFARRNCFSREHAIPFDTRAANAKFEICKLRIDTWNVMFRGHTNRAGRPEAATK
jgi:hypothetical protein